MVVIKEFAPLGRPMRVEDLDELGENTLDKLKQAVESGDKKMALAITDYLRWEGKALHDSYTDWVFAELNWIAQTYGEEQLPKALRSVRQTLDRMPFQAIRKSKGTMLDRVKMYAETMRAHRSGPDEMGDLKIREEPDRYVMTFDPCGSGGRMARGPLDGSGSRIKPPFNLGTTSKAYPWSWSKVGVPYYCLHCCVWSEVMAIEANGYPVRVTECPAGDFQKPCEWYFYKSPELIPDKYFERVGFKKDPSKFKK